MALYQYNAETVIEMVLNLVKPNLSSKQILYLDTTTEPKRTRDSAPHCFRIGHRWTQHTVNEGGKFTRR